MGGWNFRMTWGWEVWYTSLHNKLASALSRVLLNCRWYVKFLVAEMDFKTCCNLGIVPIILKSSASCETEWLRRVVKRWLLYLQNTCCSAKFHRRAAVGNWLIVYSKARWTWTLPLPTPSSTGPVYHTTDYRQQNWIVCMLPLCVLHRATIGHKPFWSRIWICIGGPCLVRFLGPGTNCTMQNSY